MKRSFRRSKKRSVQKDDETRGVVTWKNEREVEIESVVEIEIAATKLWRDNDN